MDPARLKTSKGASFPIAFTVGAHESVIQKYSNALFDLPDL